MVAACLCQVIGVTVGCQKCIHGRNRLRLPVVGADMHALHAQPLLNSQKFHGREILLLFRCSLLHRPREICLCHKVRQTDNGYPHKALLMRVIYGVRGVRTLLLPESLERRDNIIKVSLDAVVALFAHLDGIGNAVQQANGLLIRAVFLIRVTLAAHGKVVHRRHRNKRRLCFGQVKLFVFFLEIKGHVQPPYFFFLCFGQGHHLPSFSCIQWAKG